MELLQVVKEDLEYLAEEWTQDIDDASLRRASPILRKLLIEKDLYKVAREINEEISVLTPEISKFDNELDDPSIVYYQCGGATYKGLQVQDIKQLNRAKSEAEIKQNYQRGKDIVGKNYSIKLSKFMKQTAFVIEGTKINREEVIKYISNKKGGAHFDAERKIEKDQLERKYALLDKIFEGNMVAEKNAVYYELLSIGQRLIKSVDVERIRSILNNI